MSRRSNRYAGRPLSHTAENFAICVLFLLWLAVMILFWAMCGRVE